MGVGAGEGRLALRTADRGERPAPSSGLALQMQVLHAHRAMTRLSIDTGVAYDGTFGNRFSTLGLLTGVRYTAFLPDGHAFYLRPHVSLDLALARRPHAGFGFGLGVGYRKVSGARTVRFVEFAYRTRIFPDVDPVFADMAFSGYGAHPEDKATLFASFLGVVGGVGFGIGGGARRAAP